MHETSAPAADSPFTALSRPWRSEPHPTGASDTAPPRGGLLLSHGFTASPQSMLAWGKDHAARGWDVSIPLLPGHATHWRELAATDHSAWTEAIAAAADELLERHETISVGGLSMGGALALALAEDPRRAARIDALVLVNPALALPRAQAIALPVLSRVVPSIAAISGDTANGAQEEAYDRTPLRAVEQMRRLQRRVRADLWSVTAPVLLATSVVDHVVDPRCSDLVAARVAGPVERLSLTRSHHVATLDAEAALLFERSAEFLARRSGAAER